MKHLYLTITLLVSLLSFGQCPSTSITLTSQADVDAFTTNFPDCTELNSSLTISGDDITDLTPLIGITSIGGSLRVINNLNLATLNGLDNINSVSINLGISNNVVLTDISSLMNMVVENDDEFEGAQINISNNPMLLSLNGLQGIQNNVYSLYIDNNDSLTNLTGLNNFTGDGTEDFFVINNDSLINLVGLDSYNGLVGVRIINNDALENLIGFSSNFNTAFELADNDNIQTLEGLEVISSLCCFSINNNDSLIDISAMTNIDLAVNDEIDFTIINNLNLSICHIESVCSAIEHPTMFKIIDIQNNAFGCNTTQQVEAACVSGCPSGNVTLNSQADVDAFAVNYPNCTELDYLTISGDDIVDLTPLSGITSVEFALAIDNNQLLSNLNGLNSMTEINGFALGITNNPNLTDITGLSNLSQPFNSGIDLSIINNPLLVSLNGLQNLGNLGYTIIGNNDSLLNLEGFNDVTLLDNFVIDGNDSLINLIGLESLQNAGMEITNNASLQNLIGLTNVYQGAIILTGNPNIQTLEGLEVLELISVLSLINNESLNNISAIENVQIGSEFYTDISIVDNPMLSLCNYTTICNRISDNCNDCFITIENNAPGCNSIAEVAFQCNLIPSNDECNNAINIELGQTIQAYNELGTQSPQIPSCNDSANRVDVWFSFSTGDEGIFDIVVEGGVYNLQVWEGDCNNLTQVANACGVNQLLDANIELNSDYYIQVWSDGTGRATGLFDIAIDNTVLSIQDDVFNEFMLYPNPINSELHFKGINIVSSINVLNALGQNVMTVTPKVSQGVLDMSQLSNGLYFMKVHINNKVSTFKVLKN